MPKCVPDSGLRAIAQTVIEAHGSVQAAALELGMSSATLWRVSKTGKATAKTRSSLLAGASGNTAPKTENEMKRLIPSVAAHDLHLARRMLQAMVQLIDNYIDIGEADRLARAQGMGATETEDRK